MAFVHLHNHTEYSLLDGAARVKDLLTQAKEYGMTSLAITDHGVMYGVIHFYRKALELGINPIIGCEVYVAPVSRFEKSGREDLSGKGFAKLPDIIFMDGGKPQITAAEEVLAAFGLNIPVCGMFKDDFHRTKGLLFNDKEYYMPQNSEGFKLITRIQDEVHRFAIEFHRSFKDKSQLHSVLDDIPGIGPVRRKALLKHFENIENIKNAEVEDILEVEGMTIKSAEAVYSFFRNNKN